METNLGCGATAPHRIDHAKPAVGLFVIAPDKPRPAFPHQVWIDGPLAATHPNFEMQVREAGGKSPRIAQKSNRLAAVNAISFFDIRGLQMPIDGLIDAALNIRPVGQDQLTPVCRVGPGSRDHARSRRQHRRADRVIDVDPIVFGRPELLADRRRIICKPDLHRI